MQELPARIPVVFVSYAHRDVSAKDKDWLKRLKVYLKQFQLTGDFDVWDDTRIKTGAPWQKAIEAAIEQCSVAVLLVGKYFLASDYIYFEELPRILESARKKLLPLVVGRCNYRASFLGKFQAFNPPEQPLEELTKKQQEKWLCDFALRVKECADLAGGPPPENGLSVAIKILGIVDGSVRLHQSKFEPAECVKRCSQGLSFLGNLGNKWVRELGFQNFLRRMNDLHLAEPSQGLVRFLLLDPRSSAFEHLNRASTYRGGIDDKSINELKLLSRAYPCFQLKLYSHVPCFRLVFIDGIEVGFAPYRFYGCGVFGAGLGQEAPHLLIRRDPNLPWSLYGTLDRYFEQLWSAH